MVDRHISIKNTCLLNQAEGEIETCSSADEYSSKLNEAVIKAGYLRKNVLGKGGLGILEKVNKIKEGEDSVTTYALKYPKFRVWKIPNLRSDFMDEASLNLELSESQRDSPMWRRRFVNTHYANTEDYPFFVMDIQEGDDLDKIIRNRLEIPNTLLENKDHLREGILYSIQIFEALAYLRSIGVIHRDIKPGNIIVDSHGEVKLLDLGLAMKDVAAEGRKQSEFRGSVLYASPEQCGSGFNLTFATDVYSASAVAYHFFTGEFPLNVNIEDVNENPLGVVNWNGKRQSKKFKDLEILPYGLSALVKQGLKFAPSRRFLAQVGQVASIGYGKKMGWKRNQLLERIVNPNSINVSTVLEDTEKTKDKGLAREVRRGIDVLENRRLFWFPRFWRE
jgi:serine/threonine protein kinase